MSVENFEHFSINKNLDDYALCFPEGNQLFMTLGFEDRVKLSKLIIEERDKRSLDCKSRFSDMIDAQKSLNDINEEELRNKINPCVQSHPDICRLQ